MGGQGRVRAVMADMCRRFRYYHGPHTERRRTAGLGGEPASKRWREGVGVIGPGVGALGSGQASAAGSNKGEDVFWGTEHFAARSRPSKTPKPWSISASTALMPHGTTTGRTPCRLNASSSSRPFRGHPWHTAVGASVSRINNACIRTGRRFIGIELSITPLPGGCN
jgi:hypothetical protein